jgi:beta-glucanase (GH16 family)
MTHKSLLFFVFSAFLSLASAQNLALNMPVTVTSTEGGLIGENAVDGSMSTRWSSAFSEPHSISVDLGDVYDLDRVVIHWEAAFAVAYDVEVSMDGVQWTVANTVNSGNGNEDVVSLTGSTGRYVRIQCLQRVFIGGAQYGFSIYELEVYGLAPANSALLQEIYVDGAPLPGFDAETYNYVYDITDTSAGIPSLTAIAANAQASVTINNVTSLPGDATIVVTSADQSTSATYTILFQRIAYNLVWNDEFDYNGAVDPSKWFHQTYPPFNGGWANAEEQHYTNRLSNSFVDNGTLKIVAKREQYQDPVVGSIKSFTSARLNSKYAFQYGRVVVRAKLPAELGTWPAIWTLGQNVNEQGAYWQTQGYGQVSWPFCGEIDIMEQDANKNLTSGAFHFPDANGNHTYTYDNTPVANSATTWHDYAMEWTEDSIILMVDDVVFHTLDNAANPYFDNPHFLLLNVAMGGALGGAIPPSFTSSTMEIDFVRVYEKGILPPDTTNNDTTNNDTTTTSITDIENLMVSLYPNPSNGHFTIQSSSAIQSIEIFDVYGQKVAYLEGFGRHAEVDIIQPKGLYIVKARHQEGDVILRHMLE